MKQTRSAYVAHQQMQAGAAWQSLLIERDKRRAERRATMQRRAARQHAPRNQAGRVLPSVVFAILALCVGAVGAGAVWHLFGMLSRFLAVH